MQVIAPGITLEEFQQGLKLPIDIFEGQAMGWTLGVAMGLMSSDATREKAGIAALSLATSLIEPVGEIVAGQRRTGNRFRAGVRYIFPSVRGNSDISKVAETIYQALRNGLFHEGFLKSGLELTRLDVPMEEKDGLLLISPPLFVEAVTNKVSELCTAIRADPTSDVGVGFSNFWSRRQNEAESAISQLPVAALKYTEHGTSTLAAHPSITIVGKP